MKAGATLLVDTSFLGDVLCAEPLVEAAAEEFGGAVDFLTSPGGAQMLQGHPGIRALLVFDKRGADRGLSGMRRLAKDLRARGYARAVVSHRSWRTAFLVRLARIPERYGFDNASGARLYNKPVHYRKDVHEIVRNLDLVGGGEWRRPRMFPTEAERARAAELAPAPLFVALAPGSIWATKRWPAERWAELIAGLTLDGIRCVLLGGRDDEKLCSSIVELAEGYGRAPTDLSGRTTLRESHALLERAAVLVSNDSAPMHMGVAAGIPVIAVYCSTVPGFGFAPKGADDTVVEAGPMPCRPCGIHGRKVCPEKHFRCGWDVPVEAVLAPLRARLPAGASDR